MNNPKSFPDCYKNCAIAHYLGVGECESICPEKFKMNYSKINCLPWETNRDYWRCPECGSLNAELEENLNQAHNDNTACWKSNGTICGRCGHDTSLEKKATDSTNMLEAGLIQPEDIWETTKDDVLNVIHRMGKKADSDLVEQIHNDLDHNEIECEALKGDSIEEQTESAYVEIERQIRCLDVWKKLDDQEIRNEKD